MAAPLYYDITECAADEARQLSAIGVLKPHYTLATEKLSEVLYPVYIEKQRRRLCRTIVSPALEVGGCPISN